MSGAIRGWNCKMDPFERSLDGMRIAINAYMAWADTPGSVLTVLVPIFALLAFLGWMLDRRANYWRRS